MFIPLFYWVIAPLCAAWVLVRIIQRSPRPVAPDVAALLAAAPLPAKAYGAARRDAAGLASLGVHETLLDASDAAYRGREEARKAGEKASFLVFDPTGVVVEQIDS